MFLSNSLSQVLHTLCDGSPTHLEEQVMEAVEKLSKDKDAKIKRTALRVLNTYRSKGKWNIMWNNEKKPHKTVTKT